MRISVTELAEAIKDLPMLKDFPFPRMRVDLTDRVLLAEDGKTGTKLESDRHFYVEKDIINNAWLIDIS